MTSRRLTLAVHVACYLSLASLGLMAWSLVHPTPIPVILAMSLGQMIGFVGLLMFLVVVAADLRRQIGSKVGIPASKRSLPPAKPSSPGPES